MSASSPAADVALSPRTVGASVAALAGLNFFLADVRDGLGPFLGVFLVEQGWKADAIGLVMMVGGLAGMVATTPLGMLADAVRSKRAVVAVSAVLVVVATLALLLYPSGPVVTLAQIATGLTGAAIGPAIAGLTLGLVGQAGSPPSSAATRPGTMPAISPPPVSRVCSAISMGSPPSSC